MLVNQIPTGSGTPTKRTVGWTLADACTGLTLCLSQQCTPSALARWSSSGAAVAAPEVSAAVAEWLDCEEDAELLEAEAQAAEEEMEA